MMTAKLDILKSVIAAWTARDIDGALAHMHDDIVWHFAAAVAPPARGKAKARKFLENFKSELTEVRWRLFDSAETGDRLFVEGVDEFTTTTGAVVRAPYAGVLEFEGDLIIGWRDYVDVAVMEAQKAGGEASAWVMALVDRPAI
jgi:limonene-1,2-epoxide hydrolase